MSQTPLFTQKHYEHIIAELRHAETLSLAERGIAMEEWNGAVEFLCRVFAEDNPKFRRGKFMDRLLGRPLSNALVDWLDNFSQSAAVDMRGCGGDDPTSVAEQCVTCMSSYEPALYAEYMIYQNVHGHAAAMAEVVKHVRTL